MSPAGPVRTHYTPGVITILGDTAIREANSSFNEIASKPHEQRTINNTLIRFEEIMGDFTDRTGPLTFMGYVYPDRAIAD